MLITVIIFLDNIIYIILHLYETTKYIKYIKPEKKMRRRQFIKFLGLSTLFSGSKIRSFANPPKRPNILLIITDQQSSGAMSCVGNSYLNTPHMDYLANRGVLFSKAYCGQPLCVPSRGVMFTGRMPHETGITINMNKHPVKFPMLGKLLSDAGYECGYVGKWHLTIPFSEERTHGFSSVNNTNVRNLDEKVPKICAEFLKQKREKPFFLVASFVNPHDICEWARGEDGKQGSYINAPEPEECPPLPENFDIPRNEPHVLRLIQTFNRRTYPSITWGETKWRQYRWAYHRLVEKVDAEIGLLLDGLKESDQEKDTIIIFTSDHGDGAASHRWNQKQILYEEVVKVPFIVSCPETQNTHIDNEHLISTGLDLMPTICDYAGVKPPKDIQGRSVKPLVEGKSKLKWRDFVISETEFCDFGKSYNITGRMVRSNRYKYIVYSTGKKQEQLFDLQTDPGELNDLVNEPNYQRVLNEHRQILVKWCEKHKDNFQVPGV